MRKQAHGVNGMEWSEHRPERNGAEWSGMERNGDEHDGPSKKCEWQESNLRTPARIDLESITVGRLVTLAPMIMRRIQ